MRAKHLLIAVLGVVTFVIGSTAGAWAVPGREKPVVEVRAENIVLLNPDGTLTLAAQLRCDPGWVTTDLTAIVDQGPATIAEGYTLVTVPCDDRWHRFEFTIPVTVGTFQPGKVTISFLQFVVTNEVTGDPDGAHDNGGTARLRLAA
jgi:hypothetical protein